jgi:hypothetical protein
VEVKDRCEMPQREGHGGGQAPRAGAPARGAAQRPPMAPPENDQGARAAVVEPHEQPPQCEEERHNTHSQHSARTAGAQGPRRRRRPNPLSRSPSTRRSEATPAEDGREWPDPTRGRPDLALEAGGELQLVVRIGGRGWEAKGKERERGGKGAVS